MGNNEKNILFLLQREEYGMGANIQTLLEKSAKK